MGKGKKRMQPEGDGGEGKEKGKLLMGEGEVKGKGKKVVMEPEARRLSQRARTALRVNEKLVEIGKGADPEVNQGKYRLRQFSQAFIVFKSARAHIEKDLANGRISKSEKTRRMANARRQVTGAAKRLSECQTIGVESTQEMQAVADLLKSWNEIGGGGGKPKLAVVILTEDEELRSEIYELGMEHKIPVT